MGKPVIATRVGGNHELIYNGRDGVLVPAKSPRAIADKVMLLLQNRGLASALGNNARSKAEQNFSVDRMVKQYEHLLHHPQNILNIIGHQTIFLTFDCRPPRDPTA